MTHIIAHNALNRLIRFYQGIPDWDKNMYQYTVKDFQQNLVVLFSAGVWGVPGSCG